MELTLSLVVSLLVVFGLLFLVYWLSEKFGSPTGQKIVGVICLVVFALYALHRLGVLDSTAVRI